METLKPNMYVRTKNHNGFAGGVGKIEKIQDDKTHKTKWITLDRSLDGISFLVNISEITKASHNIIDLIEVGDYVNGFKIIRRFVNIHNGKKLLIALEKEEGYEYSNNLNDYMADDSIHIYDEDIKTIVTKEQFESMQYEVK